MTSLFLSILLVAGRTLKTVANDTMKRVAACTMKTHENDMKTFHNGYESD